jgi:hypothetical protein
MCPLCRWKKVEVLSLSVARPTSPRQFVFASGSCAPLGCVNLASTFAKQGDRERLRYRTPPGSHVDGDRPAPIRLARRGLGRSTLAPVRYRRGRGCILPRRSTSYTRRPARPPCLNPPPSLELFQPYCWARPLSARFERGPHFTVHSRPNLAVTRPRSGPSPGTRFPHLPSRCPLSATVCTCARRRGPSTCTGLADHHAKSGPHVFLVVRCGCSKDGDPGAVFGQTPADAPVYKARLCYDLCPLPVCSCLAASCASRYFLTLSSASPQRPATYDSTALRQA